MYAAKIVHELCAEFSSYKLGLDSHKQHPPPPSVKALNVEELPDRISSLPCRVVSFWKERAKVVEVYYVEVPAQMSSTWPGYSYPRSVHFASPAPTLAAVAEDDEIYFTVMRHETKIGHLHVYSLIHGEKVIFVPFYRSHLPKQMSPRFDIL